MFEETEKRKENKYIFTVILTILFTISCSLPFPVDSGFTIRHHSLAPAQLCAVTGKCITFLYDTGPTIQLYTYPFYSIAF